MYLPVRWTSTIHKMVAEKVALFLECGYGRVLTGLNIKEVPNVKAITLGTVVGFKEALSLCGQRSGR